MNHYGDDIHVEEQRLSPTKNEIKYDNGYTIYKLCLLYKNSLRQDEDDITNNLSELFKDFLQHDLFKDVYPRVMKNNTTKTKMVNHLMKKDCWFYEFIKKIEVEVIDHDTLDSMFLDQHTIKNS